MRQKMQEDDIVSSQGKNFTAIAKIPRIPLLTAPPLGKIPDAPPTPTWGYRLHLEPGCPLKPRDPACRKRIPMARCLLPRGLTGWKARPAALHCSPPRSTVLRRPRPFYRPSSTVYRPFRRLPSDGLESPSCSPPPFTSTVYRPPPSAALLPSIVHLAVCRPRSAVYLYGYTNAYGRSVSRETSMISSSWALAIKTIICGLNSAIT
jgi:hypothetical protein